MQDAGYWSLPLWNRAGEIVGETLVDAADYEQIAGWRCFLVGDGYVGVTVRTGKRGGRKVYLHRVIAGLAPNDPREVDHINRNRLDNRRTNLRVASRAEQMQNTSLRSDSASGFRGVSKRGHRWRASATVAGKRHELGTYGTPEEAARVVSDWRREHMPGAHD
jgi:hypothetical protein